MKKYFVYLSVLIFSIALLEAKAVPKKHVIATATSWGTFYPVDVGMNTPAGIPTSAVFSVFKELGSPKVKVLEFSEEDIEKINNNYPMWSSHIIKTGTYTGQIKDIHTISQPNTFW